MQEYRQEVKLELPWQCFHPLSASSECRELNLKFYLNCLISAKGQDIIAREKSSHLLWLHLLLDVRTDDIQRWIALDLFKAQESFTHPSPHPFKEKDSDQRAFWLCSGNCFGKLALIIRFWLQILQRKVILWKWPDVHCCGCSDIWTPGYKKRKITISVHMKRIKK